MITSETFGKTADGREVRAYVLRDGANSATVLNYGGIVQKLLVQGRENKTYNVVLGYGSPSEYDANGGYLGAFIGRVGNRIGKGKFTLDGREYRLNCNDGKNHLHGGHKGFNTKIFDAETEGGVLVLSGTSADGEENYPGNLRMEVRYSFVGGELKIEYTAVSDRKTLINLTNHTYFNLDGEGSGDILGHTLYIDADRVTTADRELIPHGEFRDVEGTPFDFRKPKKVGKDIGCTDDCDIANGEGVRVTLFVSGCTNHCKSCFQPQTWDFCYGQPFTEESEQEILKLLAPSYISGLTLLGGEPFEPENQRALLPFVRRVRARYPSGPSPALPLRSCGRRAHTPTVR